MLPARRAVAKIAARRPPSTCASPTMPSVEKLNAPAVRPRREAPSEKKPGAVIRSFRESDWEELTRFYQSRYRPGYILSGRAFFDWCFDSPFRPDERHGQRLVVDEGRPEGEQIVGKIGVMLWPIQLGGKRVLAQCPFNTYLDEDYRKGLLAYRLLTGAHFDLPYTMALNVKPEVIRMLMLRRAGEKYSWLMRRPIRVLDAEACAEIVASSPHIEGMAETERADTLAAVAEAAAPAAPAPEGSRLERVERFGEEWDAAWERIRTRYGVTAWRDAAFLNWRYADYPFEIYETHALRSADGRITGFVALREETPPFGTVLRIVDYVAEDGADAALLAHVEAVARERGAAFIDYVCSGRLSEEALAEAGYREWEPAEGESLFPMDFNPLRWRTHKIGGFFGLPDIDDGADPTNQEMLGGDFYFIKGDADLDRAF